MYPISDKETEKNKKIMEKCYVPNIFIGYKNSKNEYISSSFEMIDELFFSKDHDHDKYKNIIFNNPAPGSVETLAQIKTRLEIFSRDHCGSTLINYIQPRFPISIFNIKSGGYYNKYIKYYTKLLNKN